MPELGKRLGAGRAAEVFEYGAGAVIKLLLEPGKAAYLDSEAAAQMAAEAAGVRVPRLLGLHDIDGRRGIVMERIDGLDGLSVVDRKPWRVRSIGNMVGRLHRELSAVEAPAELRSLRDVIRERVSSSDRVPEDAKERLLALLDSLPEGRQICHMDFHPGNVMETAGGPVIIDFANAKSGAPEADFARSIVMLEAGSPPNESRWERALVRFGRRLMRNAYRSGYGPVDREAVRRWRPVIIADRLTEGIPEEREALLRMLSRSLREAGT